MLVSLKINDLLKLEESDLLARETDLVRALKKGDRKAQTRCYREYCGKMFSVALRYTSSKEDAKEIINSAFLKVFKSIKSYQEKGSFEGWIRTIVRRASIDHCRKFVYKNVPTHEILEFDAKVYNDAINQLQAEDFLQLIGKLPKASRIVFNLFAIDGYSHKEICRELQISEGTSKWHLSKARKTLIQIIKKERDGYGK